MIEEKIKYTSLKHNDNLIDLNDFSYEVAKKVNKYHSSFPEYKITPLVNLKDLSNKLGVNNIYIKDESYRFNLNAFKVLGGSFAIGNYIGKKLNISIDDLTYDKLTSDELRNKLGDITFVTATDGNHGRGVAWTANRLKQKSVVYMPKGSAKERLDNILALGSDASITELNYDNAVRLANENANKYGWVLVQDTAWQGYTDIPKWIMQGYTTMAYEALNQLNGQKPTHIFLQAGVGAMAGAVAAFFSNIYKESKPKIIIVEPNKADCIYQTAKANDNKLHFIKGDMDSIMAGLCCGEPCTIAWDILKDYADYFISIPDEIAANGMRALASNNVVSGESGAATLGIVNEILNNNKLDYLKQELNLNEDSNILCFSTEGDTDKDNYKKIVNEGLYSY